MKNCLSTQGDKTATAVNYKILRVVFKIQSIDAPAFVDRPGTMTSLRASQGLSETQHFIVGLTEKSIEICCQDGTDQSITDLYCCGYSETPFGNRTVGSGWFDRLGGLWDLLGFITVWAANSRRSLAVIGGDYLRNQSGRDGVDRVGRWT
jgi:hypothetical protein